MNAIAFGTRIEEVGAHGALSARVGKGLARGAPVLERVPADRVHVHPVGGHTAPGQREEKLDWDCEKSNFFRCFQPVPKSAHRSECYPLHAETGRISARNFLKRSFNFYFFFNQFMVKLSAFVQRIYP
jgi:hypothetical protein